MKTYPECSDQYESVDIGNFEDWEIAPMEADDITIEDNTLEFYRDPRTAEKTDGIGGAAWSKNIDFHNYQGIKISFSPSAQIDSNFYGNLKYPQGFAIVFTSSQISKNLVGNMGSGLGYDGLIDAVAFEFDFVSQVSERRDAKGAHFSAHYSNGTGMPISSTTPSTCKKYCNISIPNFYDTSKDAYYKDITFYLEIYGGKLWLYSNKNSENLINGVDFPYLEKLFEQDNVHMGITASMNLYKGVFISDLKVGKILVNKEGNLFLKKTEIEIGQSISFIYSYKTFECSKNLKIYEEDFDKIVLQINGAEYSPTLSFSSSDMTLNATINEFTKIGTFSAIIIYSNSYSNVITFEVTVSEEQEARFELCNGITYNPTTYFIENELEIEDGYFVFYLCSFDHYNNELRYYSYSVLFEDKIEFPYYNDPVTTQKYIVEDLNQYTMFKVSIYITSPGVYGLFLPNFNKGTKRYYNLKPKISSTNSKCFIDENIKTYEKNVPVKLKIIAKDQLGSLIPISNLTGCSFDDSKIKVFTSETEEEKGVESGMGEDSYYLVYTPTVVASYTFLPKIKCAQDKYSYELNCIDCTFHVKEDTLALSSFKIYSDYEKKYYLQKDLVDKYLLVNLDESKNKRLASITLIYENGMEYLPDEMSDFQFSVSIQDSSISVTPEKNPDGYFNIYLENAERNEVFSPNYKYTFTIEITSGGFSISKNIDFLFVHQIGNLNGIDFTQNTGDYVLISKLNSTVFEATKRIALYEIREKTSNFKFTSNNIDCSQVSKTLVKDGISYTDNLICFNNLYYATLYGKFEEAGTYSLTVNGISLTLEVVANSNVAKIIGAQAEEVPTTDELSFKLTMQDTYGNSYSSINGMKAFNSLKINEQGLTPKLNFNGEIFVTSQNNEAKNQSVTFSQDWTMEQSYTFTRERIAKILDTKISYGTIQEKEVEIGKELEMFVYLFDSYNNTIDEGQFESIKNYITVYMINNYNTKIKSFEYSNSITVKGVNALRYNVSFDITGEYAIKIFYKNNEIKCKGCNIKLTPKTADVNYRMFIVSNKINIPVFLNDTSKVQIVDKNSDFYFYIETYDSFDNKISRNITKPKITSSTTQETRRVNKINTNDETQYYYQLQNSLKDLTNGIFNVEIGNSAIFGILITDEQNMYANYEKNKVSTKNSFVWLHYDKVYASADKPLSLIIDLRNEENKRFDNINLDDIEAKLSSSEGEQLTPTYKLFYGPSRGLVTMNIQYKVSGEYNLIISLKDQQDKIEELQFTNYPGRAKKLEKIDENQDDPNDFDDKNKYVSFYVKDDFGNRCSLNELNNKNFREYFITAQDSSNKQIKCEKYYNDLQGILTLKFDFSLDGDISIKTILNDEIITITLPLALETTSLLAYLDKDDNKKLNVIVLNSNLKKVIVSETDANTIKNSLTATLIHIVNDIFTFVKEYQTFTYDSSNGVFTTELEYEKSGDYLVIPYYKTKEIDCNNCKSSKTIDETTFDTKKVYLKTGLNEYTECFKDSYCKLAFNTYPVFKINLYKDGSLIRNPSEVTFKFEIEGKDDINLEKYIDLNGDIYVYLEQNSILTFEDIAREKGFTLKITASGEDETLANLLNEGYVKKEPEFSSCSNDATPEIENYKSTYTFRADRETLLELKLEGCEYQMQNYYENLTKFKINNELITMKVIPSEKSGNYLLFVSSKTSDNFKFKVQYGESKESSEINLNVIPGYTVKNIKFKEDALNYESNSVYAGFYFDVIDDNENKVTFESRSVYYRDIFLNVVDEDSQYLPYRITYDTDKNSFYGEVKINGNGKIYVSQLDNEENKITINIKASNNLENSITTVETKDSMLFKVSIELRDEFNKPITENLDISNSFGFIYYTYDLISGKKFEIYLTSEDVTFEGKIATINIANKYPVYSYYVIIPKIQLIYESLCNGCMMKSDQLSTYYLLINGKLEPMSTNQKINLEKSVEYPFYVFVMETETEDFEVTGGDLKLGYEVIQCGTSSNKINIVYAGFNTKDHLSQTIQSKEIVISVNDSKGKEIKITVNVFNELTIKDDLVLRENIKMYGSSTINYYSGDLISFYLEFRDSENYLTKKSTAIYAKDDLTLIMIPSSMPGIYLIIVSTTNVYLSKKYTISLSSTIHTNVNLFFDVKAAFPSKVTFDNPKEISFNFMRLEINAVDANNNKVCDDRMNILTNSETDYKFSVYQAYYSNENCYIYIKFTGKVEVTSLFSDYSTILSNIDMDEANIYNSYFTVYPNIFNFNDDYINLKLSLINKIDNKLSDHTIKSAYLTIYRLISLHSLEKVTNDEKIYLKENEIGVSNFDLEKDGDYVLSIKIDGKVSLKMISFKDSYKGEFEANKFNMKLLMGNEIEDISDYLYSDHATKKISLTYPFEFRINVLNEEGKKLPLSEEDTISVKLLKTDEILSFDTELISEFEYKIFVSSLEKNEKISHLSKDDYTIKINYITGSEEIAYSLSLSLPNSDYHETLIEGSYESDNNEPSVFSLKLIKNTVVFTSINYYIKNVLCFIHDVNNKEYKYNQYINRTKLVVKDGCEYYADTLQRGCVDLYLKCSESKISIEYGDQKSSTTLEIKNTNNYPFNSGELIVHPDSEIISGGEKQRYDFKMYDSETTYFSSIDPYALYVYINGELFEHSSLAQQISYEDNNIIRLYIPKDYLTYKNYQQNITFYFYYRNTMKEMNFINDNFYTFNVMQGNFSSATLFLPIAYKAGDKQEFYILFLDSQSKCIKYDTECKMKYGDDIDLEMDYKQIDLKGNDNCQFALLATGNNSNLIRAGEPYYSVKLSISNSSETYSKELMIIPNDIDSDKSYLTVADDQSLIELTTVTAGNTLILRFNGTDKYDNQIDFYSLIENLEIVFEDLGTESYDYSMKVDNSENVLIIYLIITKIGLHNINLKIEGKTFEYRGLRKINVNSAECILNKIEVSITETQSYPGEYNKLYITCKDKYDNKMTGSSGTNLYVKIVGTGLEVVESTSDVYKPEYQETDMIFVSSLYMAFPGNYEITIYLESKEYSEKFNVTVSTQSCLSKDTPYMCPDKSCVKTIQECTSVISPECKTSSFIEQGLIYYCYNGETTTCSKIEDCQCDEGFVKCDGRCLPSEKSYCEKKIVSNCKDVASKLYPNVNITDCNDGTCRIGRCPNPLTCPVGYKPCKSTCILFSETCEKTESESCGDKVECWDGSCAYSYDECPTRKTCASENEFVCPDGSCVSGESQCIQPPICNEGEILCPDYTCKSDTVGCLPKPVCPIGMSLCENNECKSSCDTNVCGENEVLCPTGQCVKSYGLCPSEMYCPEGFVKCSNNGCAKTQAECLLKQGNDVITCPITKPILCPDLSCVQKSQECGSDLPECPPNAPYLCWNNECKVKMEFCPTKITCPDDTPVLCNDGHCAKASYVCNNRVKEECSLKSKTSFICWNGDCVTSPLLCPSLSICPEGSIKCWNGACVGDKSECRPLSDVEDCEGYLCHDGICRESKDDCPTIAICPLDKPVKCYDMSCRSHIDLCPEYQSCGSFKKSCPDGTCASSFEECNTMITCNSGFLCNNNLCASNVDDCEPIDSSCEGKFLCPKGECSTSRTNCKFFEACPEQTPVHCDLNFCSETKADCSEMESCPSGYVDCGDGTCKSSRNECKEFKCPPHRPYKCPEGVCELDSSYCDKPNGCPYNAPLKCPKGGSCVFDLENCDDDRVENCTDTKIRCPDGSCQEEGSCPEANGCPSGYQKCADGNCINPETDECDMVHCPIDYPIQCLNGDCKRDSAECSSTSRAIDYIACSKIGMDGLFMCANGRCVVSPELCRPVFKCDNEFALCNDLTCRIDQDSCPTGNNCNPYKRFRNGGKCYMNESTYHDQCPEGFEVCAYTGECMNDTSSCNPILENGCEVNGTFKCNDGRCLESEDQCKSIDIACSSELPFLCPNGTCVKNKDYCSDENECEEGYVRCEDKTCVLQGTENENCKNSKGCYYNKPFKCSDGECVVNPFQCNNSISCDKDKPYLCSDKQCVKDINQCKIFYTCTDGYFYCDAIGNCVKNEEECDKLTDKKLCPISTPIRCSSGKCVANYMECSQSFMINECPYGQFYCNRLSKCVKSTIECVGKENTEENSCDSDNPYLCYDGICVKDESQCPKIKSCNYFEYRCGDGSCRESKEECPEENEELCSGGKKKCQDGICRDKCPEYDGCPIGQMLCTTGKCVWDELECIGYSMCPDFDKPYRCFSGDCVSDPKKCEVLLRSDSVNSIEYTVSVSEAIKIDLAYDGKYDVVAKLEIPGNSIQYDNNDRFGLIKMNILHHSEFLNNEFYNNSDAFVYNISNSIVATDGKLTFDSAVLSPIIKIEPEVNANLKYPGLLSLKHNDQSDIASAFYAYDLCFSKFTNSKWECIKRLEDYDDTDFRVDSFGIYAILLNPSRNYTRYGTGSKNFFFENLKVIIIALAIFVVVGGIVFYVFSRVYRYREKYKNNLKRIRFLQEQKKEYENMTTDVFGQTLGDNILGLVFTKNAYYKSESQDSNIMKDMTLEEEISNLELQCQNVDNQNKRLQENIREISENYKKLTLEIHRDKK